MRHRSLSVFLSLLVVAGCVASGEQVLDHPANLKLQQEVANIVQAVREEQGTALLNRLQLLVAYDVFAVDQVSELARDKNPRLRSNALWVLGQIDAREEPAFRRKIEKALHRGLKDRDRLVRYEAARGLLQRNDWEVIPMLLQGLEDSRPDVRTICHEALVSVTSNNFGYLADSPSDERQAAVRRWKTWYKEWQRSS